MTRETLNRTSNYVFYAACATLVGVAVFRAIPQTRLADRVTDARPAVDAVSLSTRLTSGIIERVGSVILIEYSDFECPFCGRYSRETYPRLRRDYADASRVEYVFRSFPLPFHPHAFQAAEAALCAGEQKQYWPMHDRLFSDQRALTLPHFLGHVRSLGLDDSRFEQCLNGPVEDAVKAEMAEGIRLGVTSTPTFFFGRVQADGQARLLRRIVGAQPYATFRAALDELLANSPSTM